MTTRSTTRAVTRSTTRGTTSSVSGGPYEPVAPAFTIQPTNVTADEGTNASFTSRASGHPSPTYQWEVNDGGGWDTLGGATNRNLTLTAVTAAMDGYQYRNVATNTEGTDTSDVVTLTVEVDIVFTITPSTATPVAGVDVTWSTNAGDLGTPVSYSWDFGDGTIPGYGATPSHYWVSTESYTVTCTVTMSTGATHTDTQVITPTAPTASTGQTRIGYETFASTSNAAPGDFDYFDVVSTVFTPGLPNGAKLAAATGIGYSGKIASSKAYGRWSTGSFYDQSPYGGAAFATYYQVGCWFKFTSYPSTNLLLAGFTHREYTATGSLADGVQINSSGGLFTTTGGTLSKTVPLNTWFWVGVNAGLYQAGNGGNAHGKFMYKEIGSSVEVLASDILFGNGVMYVATLDATVGCFSVDNLTNNCKITGATCHSLLSLTEGAYPNELVPPQDANYVYRIDPANGSDSNNGVTGAWQTITKINAMMDVGTAGLESSTTADYTIQTSDWSATSGHAGVYQMTSPNPVAFGYIKIDGSNVIRNVGTLNQLDSTLYTQGEDAQFSDGRTVYIKPISNPTSDGRVYTLSYVGSGAHLKIDTSVQRLDVEKEGLKIQTPGMKLYPIAGQTYVDYLAEVVVDAGDWTVTSGHAGVYQTAIAEAQTRVVGDGIYFKFLLADDDPRTLANLLAQIDSEAAGCQGVFGGVLYIKPYTDPRSDGKVYSYGRVRDALTSPGVDTVGIHVVSIASNDIWVRGVRTRMTNVNNNGSYVVGDVPGFAGKLRVEDVYSIFSDKHAVCYTIGVTDTFIHTLNAQCEQGESQVFTDYMGSGSGNIHEWYNCSSNKCYKADRSSSGVQGFAYYSHGGGSLYERITMIDCNLYNNAVGSEGPAQVNEWFGCEFAWLQAIGGTYLLDTCTLHAIPTLTASYTKSIVRNCTIDCGVGFQSIPLPRTLTGIIDIVNNTFDMTLYDGAGTDALWTPGALDLTFTNNVVTWGTVYPTQSTALFGNMATADIVSIDNNTYHNTSGRNIAYQFDDGGGAANYLLPGWQGLGYDTSSTED